MSEEDTNGPTKEPSKAGPRKEVETRTVAVKASGGYTLPSGAQFLLQPGTLLELPKKDAQFLLDNDLAE